MIQPRSRQEAIELLKEKIEDVRVAMLTTVTRQGPLRSVPMQTSEVDDEGSLWFFTGESSDKIQEIRQNPLVCLTYANPEKNVYVSVQGTAQQVNDRAKKEQLYTPVIRAWFQGGVDDPDLTLLKVNIAEAEYWEGSSSKLVVGFNLLKAIVTGQEYDEGEHGAVTL